MTRAALVVPVSIGGLSCITGRRVATTPAFTQGTWRIRLDVDSTPGRRPPKESVVYGTINFARAHYSIDLFRVLSHSGITNTALLVAPAVAGGGSQLNELGGIDFAEVEIQLADRNGPQRMTVEALEQAGAPEGSEILYRATVVREFGTSQCVAVYLDGVSLPDEVYADLDFDELLATLGNAAGPDSYRGFWPGPQETGLFYFGPNADELFARIEPALLGLPIGQNARVVVRAGRPGLPSRTVRMPRA